MKFSKIGDSLYIKGRIGWKGLKKSEYLTDGEYRIINATSIVEGQIDWSDAGFISKERYDESPEIMLQNNDILISKDGTIGKVGLVSNLPKPATVASGVFVVRNLNHDKWNIKYLYYYFMSIYFKNFIESRKEGSVIPHLYQRDFEQLNIPEYSITIQNKIVDILDSITNKIRVNQQINDNLVEMATALFNSKVVNNTNFEEKSLTEIANYKNGLAMQKFRPKDGETVLPVLKIRELNQGSTDGTTELATSTIDEAVKVFDGDVIFSWSGTLLVKLWTGGDAALNQHLFKVTSTKYPKWFYYLWTLHHLRRFQNVAKSKATTMGHIKRSDLSDSKVLVPDTEELSELNTIFEPIIEQIVNLGIQIKLLEKTRDQLLPKLLSGEIELN